MVVKIKEPKEQSKATEAKVELTNRIIRKVKQSNGDLGGGLIIKKDSIKTDGKLVYSSCFAHDVNVTIS
jgi:hypothetical protein